MWHMDYGWGFFPFLPLFGLIFWVLVIFLVFGVFRRFGGHDGWHLDESAEGILKERFARGEINEKEFEERLTALKKHSK